MKTLSIVSLMVILILTSIQSFAQQKIRAGYGIAVIQTEPEFPGGTQALASYLRKEAHYHAELMGSEERVKIYVGFIADKSGKIKDAFIVTGSDSAELDAEALRIVQQMPDWKPGAANDIAVDRQVIIPIQLFSAKK